MPASLTETTFNTTSLLVSAVGFVCSDSGLNQTDAVALIFNIHFVNGRFNKCERFQNAAYVLKSSFFSLEVFFLNELCHSFTVKPF